MPATRWLAAACAVSTLVACANSAPPPPRAEHKEGQSLFMFAASNSRELAAPLTSAGYLTVADALAARLGSLWDVRGGYYRAGSGTVTEVNADMLLVHSAAAVAGHPGAARDDVRAVRIARFLTGAKIWRGAGSMPGWRAGPANNNRHVVFQAEAIEGLQVAYRARRAIGLDAATAKRIRHQIATVARSERWRWPAREMNQLNWNATVFAADAAVNGRRSVFAAGLGRHLARFTREARGVGARPGNFGPGLRFHYQPARWPHARMNFDSPEYANIVLSFARVYGQARAAGMPAPRELGLLRDWVRRAISGYWTHAGALNWDTGLGYHRWQQSKKVALAQGALLGVATAPELQPDPRWGRWAKWLLDRGLVHYVAQTESAGRIPDALAHGVNVVPQNRGNAYLAAARHAANAMRALQAGLGRARGAEPSALYAFDPDTGRLAVTTPRYSTAIVAVNHRAFPYGGLDLARLLGADGQVIGTLGGTGTAGFGLRVGTRRTQYGRRAYAPGAMPLRLVHAPGDAVAAAARVAPRGAAMRAYAGPFSDLRVRGSAPAGTVEYRFTPTWIEARWRARGRGGVVTFPSWGRNARIREIRPGTYAIGSGYTVTVRGARSTRIVRPRPQNANPNPGPTLEVALAGTELSARLVPR
ncbi:hypothetical protein OJ998_30295 [Solirubrobacter taibaiensis]|nr:hypothetical protein [Solirubrobacter taibaiensis]